MNTANNKLSKAILAALLCANTSVSQSANQGTPNYPSITNEIGIPQFELTAIDMGMDATGIADQQPEMGADTPALAQAQTEMESAENALKAFLENNPWLQIYLDSEESLRTNQEKANGLDLQIKEQASKLASLKDAYSKAPKVEAMPELKQQIQDSNLLIKQIKLSKKSDTAEYKSALKSNKAKLSGFKKELAKLKAGLSKNPNDESIKASILSTTDNINLLEDTLRVVAVNYLNATESNKMKLAELLKQISVANKELKNAKKSSLRADLSNQIDELERAISTIKQTISKTAKSINADTKSLNKLRSDLKKDKGSSIDERLSEYAGISKTLEQAKANYQVYLAENNSNQTPTTNEPPVATPTPDVNPEPAVDPTPVVTPTPVVDPTPVVTPTPVVDPTPVVTPTPVVDPTPVVTPTPVVDPTPVVTPTPVVDPTPVVTPTPVVDPTPVVTPTPVVDPTQVVTPTPVVDPTPTATTSTEGQAAAAEPTPVIDLMVVYTTETQTSTEAKQKINLLVDIANQSYVDSNIDAKIRLIHTRPTSDVPGTVINAIKEKSDNGAVLPTFAASTDIRALRSTYGADLVMLYKPYYAQTSTTCGVSYIAINGSNGKLSTTSYRGYSVVNEGYSKDAASSKYCNPSTFAHEIGHSLGNVHERENSTSPGAYPYSYAWGVTNSFGTIMGYKKPLVMVYSTPELATQCNGGVCGYPEGDSKESDQVKSMRVTIPQVSNFYSSITTTPDIR